MKKLGLALVLTLAFGAGSVFAQNSNTSGGTSAGGTMAPKHGRRHHRRHHRRRHHRRAKTTGNTNS